MTDSRRFAGTYTLYGDAFAAKDAHVYIIGVGGVGSWAAEGLARTAIGTISLIDMDVIAPSNINRQLPALSDTLGENKVDIMAARIHGINPNCQVNAVDDFLTPDNVASLLPDKSEVAKLKQQGKTVIVLDCVDDIQAKLAIALHCRFHKIKLVVSGGAGGKIDPNRIAVADLKDVYQDPLLAKLRSKLREHGINRQLREKFAIKCVYSSEPPKPAQSCTSKLACQGYGSSVVMTASMGFRMVAECLKWLTT